MKSHSRSVLLLLALVALTGCLRLHAHLTLNPNNTTDAVMVIAVKPDGPLGPGGAEDRVKEMFERFPLFIDSEAEDYKADGYVGKKLTVRGMSLQGLGSTTPVGIEIVRVGDEFVVKGGLTSNIRGTPLPPVDPARLAKLDVRFSVTFPGKVTEHDGQLNGRTVTWKLDSRGPGPVNARGSAIPNPAIPQGGPDSAGAGLLWIGVGVVVTGGVFWFFLLRSKRRRRVPTGGHEGSAPPGGFARPGEHEGSAPPGVPLPPTGQEPPDPRGVA